MKKHYLITTPMKNNEVSLEELYDASGDSWHLKAELLQARRWIK
jgi:hypothetical protein